MKIISNKKDLEKNVHNEKNLGFVPTMGGIHLGHISLIKKSIIQCGKTIVSIFINKPQFNRRRDFLKYPRSIKKDIVILKKFKVDILYTPSMRQMYPEGPNKKIKIIPFGKKLCGKNRPGHFEAVTDVIDKFIKIIKPKKIFFGEKDMQQLKIITHFVKKNHHKTKVVGCKTIREKNGIAYSSRNFLLNEREKIIASNVYKLLINNKKKLIKNKLSLGIIKKKIFKLGVNQIDYIQILDVNKIIPSYQKKNKLKIFVAYYLGSTRLIDNI